MRKLSLILALLLISCGYVYDKELIGPYRLVATDVDEQMSVCYSLVDGDCIGRIDGTVFSVGWNIRYIVAKQHPNNDRSFTHYYYLDMRRDAAYADPSASVTGPLTQEEFEQKAKELALPAFTLTIDSLQ